MGRAPCCDKANVKKGPWSPEEDARLKDYIEKHGTGGNWIALPQKAGLRRCGKSCRLRWLNYLRPNIKHGDFSDDEDRIICSLFASIGSRWSIIAAQLPGRTDNDIKNYWNTKLKKKLETIAPSQKRPLQSLAYASVSILDPSSSMTSSPYSAPSLALSSTRSVYRCSSGSNYYIPARSFTGYENLSVPSSILNATCSSNISAPSVPQIQQSHLGSLKNYQLQDNTLRFGGEASCSSSDGSSTNQISYGSEVEHEYGAANVAHVDLQSYLCNGVEGNQPNGSYSYGGNPLDYGFEEIKQLISTNLCNDFFVDENTTQGKVTLYW